MISLVIPTHHRPKSLRLLLESLHGELLESGADDLEIIVVVDGRDEVSLQTLEHWKKRMPLRYLVHEEAKGAAVARNSGVEIAYGDVYAFLDDDVVVRVGWLPKLRELLQDPQVDIWSGTVCYHNESYRGAYPDRIVENQHSHFPLGAHLVVRRKAFRPFEHFFAELHNEDTAFILACLEGGACLKHAPDLKVFHCKDWWASPWAVVASAKYVEALPCLIKKHPRHFATLPIARFGPLLFPLEFFMLLCLPVLICPLFLRYLYVRSSREHFLAALPYFLAKWPMALLMRRLYLWKSAWKNRVFIV